MDDASFAKQELAPSPSPWKVAEARGPDGELCFHEVIDADGHTILSTWAYPHLANARLTAAAVEMLSALREVEEFLDNHADADDGIPNDAMRHLVEVRAAISKAEGR